jgi:phage tail-like protein
MASIPRETPFNFIVQFGGDNPDGEEPLGGFSDVTGLGTEVVPMEYRYGNDKENRMRKRPGLYKTADTTFKRGIMGLKTFTDWMVETRRNPLTGRNLTVTLKDEAGEPVMSWRLINARPLKFSGPALAAKGGADVAMEELVVMSEGIEFMYGTGA